MMMQQNENELARHICLVGQLVVQLQSIEVVVRGAVRRLAGEQTEQLDFDRLEVGQRVAVTPLTSYAGLKEIIVRFNALVPADGDRIDEVRLVSLRDMLAHGRVFTTAPTRPFRVVKFGKETDGTVPVEAVHSMTDEWLIEQV